MKSILTGAMLALAITAAEAVEDPINASPYVTTAILDDCEALTDGRGSESIFYGVLCRAIISGLVYGAQYGHCLAFPNSVTREQAIRVIVLYIKASQKYLKFQLLRAACSNFCVGYPRIALVPPVLRST
jgi:hypothetical protein